MCPRAGKKSRSNDSENVFFFLSFFPLGRHGKEATRNAASRVSTASRCCTSKHHCSINNPSFKRGKTTWVAWRVMTLKGNIITRVVFLELPSFTYFVHIIFACLIYFSLHLPV